MSATFEVTSPATGQTVGTVPDAGVEEATEAAARSIAAFETWRRTTAYERRGPARLGLGHPRQRSRLARLMAEEMGKPVTEGRGEAAYAAAFVEGRRGGQARLRHDRAEPDAAQAHPRAAAAGRPGLRRHALNFPAAMVTRKAAPAPAAGCTVVLKPAEQSPLTALRLGELWREVGGHPDVFQVMPTSDPATVSAVFDDPAIRKLSFTGSTEVGVALAAQATKTMKRVSLELGGHAPFLVFGDADLDAAVREVFASKFRNAGQTCVCANRIYVHADIHDAFVERFAEAVRGLRAGDPLDDTTQIGPLVDRQGLGKVQAHVEDALARGATAAVGGRVRDGLTFEPTLLTGVTRGMRILEEETFGPVAPVIRFTEDAEAVRMANDTRTGSPPTCGRVTSHAPSVSPRRSTTASSASTTACPRRRRRRLAASRCRASAARAGAGGSRSTWTRSTCRWRSERLLPGEEDRGAAARRRHAHAEPRAAHVHRHRASGGDANRRPGDDVADVVLVGGHERHRHVGGEGIGGNPDLPPEVAIEDGPWQTCRGVSRGRRSGRCRPAACAATRTCRPV